MGIRIIRGTPSVADMQRLALSMRRRDREELRAVGVDSALQGVKLSVACADKRFVFCAVDEFGCMVAIGGVSTRGAPWLLGTDLLDRRRLSLTRYARRFIGEWLRHYPLLSNVIDARQTAGAEWLKALGFTLEPCAAVVEGFDLFRFSMGRRDD
jgi:hypothetical protein